MQTEYILQAAGDAFRKQFEQELRQKLLDIATAEIEQLVREVSASVSNQVGMHYECLDKSFHLTHNVRVTHARTS